MGKLGEEVENRLRTRERGGMDRGREASPSLGGDKKKKMKMPERVARHLETNIFLIGFLFELLNRESIYI